MPMKGRGSIAPPNIFKFTRKLEIVSQAAKGLATLFSVTFLLF